jgi:hypothetical protein
MSRATESALADPQQVIADPQRQLEKGRAERDEALAAHALPLDRGGVGCHQEDQR